MSNLVSSLNFRRLAIGLAAAIVACAFAGGCTSVPAGPVQHRFLAGDFWKKKIWYVNEARPGENWSVDLPSNPMDLQLVGKNQVMVSLNNNGYSILDLNTRKLVKHHNPKEIAGSVAARRLADGRTIVGANKNGKWTLVELDAAGAYVREWAFPTLGSFRGIRPTPQGTWLISENNGVAEVTLADGVADDKRILRQFKLPRSRNAYMGLRLADGRTLVGGGYAAGLFEYGADGKLTREMVATQPQGMLNYFYAAVQVLKNGHIVVSNWTGHGEKDYHPGWKIIEFDQTGKAVWHWYETAPDAGTINDFIILDGLDTGKFNE